MKTYSPQLRSGFRLFNRLMVLLWQAGLGAWVNFWPSVVGRIMVLTHHGRRTGARHRTPVNYTLFEDEVYCVAGFGGVSDWYRNLLAHPEVEVWLPEGWWAGVAEEVTDPAWRLPVLRQVLLASGFAARAVGLNPVTDTDEALAAATADYRLMRIRRTAARTGAGGPGEYAWFWPLATVGLLALLARRRPKDN